MKKMVKPLQGIRVLATLGILVYHVAGFNLARFLVSLFFILSGFFCYYTNKEKSFKVFKDTPRYLYKKWKSFFFLHVIAWLFFVLSIYGIANIVRNYKEFLIESILNLTFVQVLVPGYAMIMNEPSWYLSCLMIIFTFSIVLIKYLQKIPHKWMWILFVGVDMSAWIISICLPSAYISPLYRVTEFFLGMIVSKIYLSMLDKAKGKMSTWSLIETIIVVLLIFLWASLFFVEIEVPYAFGLVTMCIFILVFALGRGVLSGFISHKLFQYAAKYTMAFYLFHETVLRILRENFEFFSSSPIGLLSVLVCTFLITAGLSVLVTEIIAKVVKMSKEHREKI